MRGGRITKRRILHAATAIGVSTIYILSMKFSAAAPSSINCPDSFSRFTLKSDPQLKIWKLEEAGRSDAARKLKNRVEKSLRTSKIVSFEEVEGHEGTNLTFLNFADGSRGVWKSANPIYTTPAAVKKELTAYKLDQILGSKLVPITVERTFNGRKGVVQLFVRNIDDKPLVFNPRILGLFDFLTAHPDRMHTNYLTLQGRTVAIDNEGTFEIAGKWTPFYPEFDRFIAEQLKSIKEAGNTLEARAIAVAEISPSLISRDVIERLKNTTDQQWREGLPELNLKQLTEFLDRKNRAVAAIHQAELVLGDALYPAGPFSGLSRNMWPGESERLEKLLTGKLPKELKAEVKKAKMLIDRHIVSGKPLAVDEIRAIDETLLRLESAE
jgi:hypothetical protein